MVPKGTLTTRQRKFAEAVAAGETGAAAYRAAYNTKASPHSQSNDATRLKRHPVISQQIEALKLANEAMAYASAAQVRQLVIQSLIQTLIDPATKAATRVTCAKVLGSVTEIAAFTDRKEITHVKDSGAIRDQIMQQLKTVLLDTQDAQDVDALLSEIAGDPINPANQNQPGDNPTLSGDAHFATGTPPSTKHSTPLKRSKNNLAGSHFPQQMSTVDASEDPPSGLENGHTGGDISGAKE